MQQLAGQHASTWTEYSVLTAVGPALKPSTSPLEVVNDSDHIGIIRESMGNYLSKHEQFE